MNPLDQPQTGLTLALYSRSMQFSERQDGPRFRVRFETSREAWEFFQMTQTAGMRVAGRFVIGDGDQVYQFEALNPNPTAGRNRSGEVYRLAMEVSRPAWLWLLDYTRPEDVLGMRLWRDDDVPEPDERRPYSGVAKRLHQVGFFRSQTVAKALAHESTFADWVRGHPCLICRQFDYDKDSGLQATQYAHVTKINAGDGTATKPPYHAVPLCGHHHRLQHNSGWAPLYQEIHFRKTAELPVSPDALGKEALEWADRQATEHRSRWAHEVFRKRCEVESLTQAPPELIERTAAWLGIEWALPDLEESHERA